MTTEPASEGPRRAALRRAMDAALICLGLGREAEAIRLLLGALEADEEEGCRLQVAAGVPCVRSGPRVGVARGERQ